MINEPTRKEKKQQREARNYCDYQTQMFIIYMCKSCEFYNNNCCSKKRVIRECAKKGLKNKD